MRSAPFGLVPHIASDAVYKLSADAASLTHGASFRPAERRQLQPPDPPPGRRRQPAGRGGGGPGRRSRGLKGVAPELPERLEAAIRLAEPGVLPPEELVRELGEGWVAEEAFAVGLYAVLATAPRRTAAAVCPEDHFRAADRAGSQPQRRQRLHGVHRGQHPGRFLRRGCLPEEWLEALEAPEVIRGMADLLVGVTTA